MTAAEVFEMVSAGGATEFSRVISLCETAGPYCLIGGLAVNCYVDPVYTMDADLVIVSDCLAAVTEKLAAEEFKVETFPFCVNVSMRGGSKLRIQFTTDVRYQSFPSRAVLADVLELRVKVACLEDVMQGKIWAWLDPTRRFTKRMKDQLDLARLAESYPRLLAMYPQELRTKIEKGEL